MAEGVHLLILTVNNFNPHVLDLLSPLLLVLQQAPLLILLEVIVLEHSFQLFRDVSEEVENLLGSLVSEGDFPGAETLALPAGVTNNCEEIMFMPMLQWIQECMMVAQWF